MGNCYKISVEILRSMILVSIQHFRPTLILPHILQHWTTSLREKSTPFTTLAVLV